MDNPIEILSKDEFDKILDEIVEYSVDLEPDPTLPHLGVKYLNEIVAKCRSYQNRVQYYLQKVKILDNALKRKIKIQELDLHFKMQELLADNPIVRQQSSIEDRKAIATTMLATEYKEISDAKILQMDAEETYKVIKARYDLLRQTSQDIRTQRNLVKDDMLARMGGQSGYDSPQMNRDGTIPNGLKSPIKQQIVPTDLLDPNKRPDDIPEPIDEAHAKMIANFLNDKSTEPNQTPKPKEEDVKMNVIDINDDLFD